MNYLNHCANLANSLFNRDRMTLCDEVFPESSHSQRMSQKRRMELGGLFQFDFSIFLAVNIWRNADWRSEVQNSQSMGFDK